MGQKFLIDTNILIDFQTKRIPQSGLDFVADAIDDTFIISFVSYIEFLGYKNVTKAMEDFISIAETIEINKAIINQTVLIRKANKISFADAVIAATAMVHNLTLLSHNAKDFKKIRGLRIIDPHNI